MNIKQIISKLFLLAALGLNAWRTDWQSVSVFLITAAYAASIEFSSRQKIAGDSDTLNQIKDLQNKVQALMLAKGMGR